MSKVDYTMKHETISGSGVMLSNHSSARATIFTNSPAPTAVVGRPEVNL
jgi:hypothetical protein